MKPANVMLDTEDVPILMDFGSMGPGIITIRTPAEARKLQVGERLPVFVSGSNTQ